MANYTKWFVGPVASMKFGENSRRSENNVRCPDARFWYLDPGSTIFSGVSIP